MAGELLAVPVAEFGLEAYAIDLLDDVAEVRLRIMDRLVVDAWPDLFENESEKESCLEIPDLRLELLLEVSLDRGEQAALDQAVDLLKPGGKLMLVGIPAVERVSFIIDRIRRKEICIQNIRRQCDCVQPVLDLMEHRKIRPDFMVTHRFSFTETRKAFDLVAGYRDGVVKAMIRF